MKGNLRRGLALLFGLLMATSNALAFDNSHYAKSERATVSTIAAAQLPPEARTTLKLIEQGGPFPYRKDGVVFGNRETKLPKQRYGYYHEYTVKTPGARNRGARRIISGGTHEYYYSDDHYRSFKRILE